MPKSLERTNQEWIRELKLPSPQCDAALAELRARLLASLGRAFAGRRSDVEAGMLEDLVQESLLRIGGRLDSFRGESRFLTWATKVAVSLALTEFRRRRWRDVSLEGLELRGFGLPDGRQRGPEESAVRGDLLAALERTMRGELTAKQRAALIATRLHGVPLDEVARRMGTNRNAVYKLLFDARRRLKRALLSRGLTAEEILDAFR